MNPVIRWVLIPTLSIFWIVPVNAGALDGVVSDPAGLPVANARVNLVTRGAQQRLTAYSDATGHYRFTAVVAGDYLVQAEADGLVRSEVRQLTIGGASEQANFQLGVAAVRSEILVTANGGAQSSHEIAKSIDSVDGADLNRRALASATEPLRYTAGMRVQTLGGPGAFTRIMTRGLRPQDTEIAIDGLRFRDAATTQGDATPFLENLFLVDTERVEVLRGTGSSIYGSHATGGVVNLVTGSGGGPLHGEVRAEGGGLGMMRGVMRLAGGTRSGRVTFSTGLGSVDVLRGLDGDDRYRNTTAQAGLQARPRAGTLLGLRFWGGNSFAQINSTPYAAPASALPASGAIWAVPVSQAVQARIEAGLPFSYAGANFVPALNDPDSRRVSHFGSGALTLSQRVSERIGLRMTYHRVVTRRVFDDGPAGVRFPPRFSVSDRIRGGTDTAEARADVQVARWNTLTGGYEFERESYRSRHLEFAPPSLARPYFTAAGQNDHSLFFLDQTRLLRDRLQLSVSGRLQEFGLRPPEFAEGVSLYQGLRFQSPPRAKTGDVSAAYLIPGTSTKLRAHTGNGYRSPSVFERFGSTFFEGVFTPLGDPRLRPERTWAFDGGLDQYLFGQKLQVSATWFYTNLQETIAFDSSGFLAPALDPFRRASGYINTGGGIARGLETSLRAAPRRGLNLTAAYTYTNADLRRSTVRDRDFFGMPFVSAQQFSATVSQSIGKRLDVNADIWIAGPHPAIFSNRAFLFDGPRKVDLVANYRIPIHDRLQARVYAKLSNVLDSQYLEGGYRTPGRWGIGGLGVEF